ncbi:MAG TPA: hypothetical protein IAA67_03150 [Candidatus Avoscillospira stercorigallinarum]|uniref:Chitin-binding type-3 domain-containing protein n=1 Tax=Candidatus Avoscillospira stercorigallinarum TaxID=2840708 RepID=A0A9D0Z7I6_9FIRM|nr:hypothetical protein [Candidatus Avoscillospira stercorigallinarum]
MKICENGVTRDMTPEEEAAWNQSAQEQPEQPPTVETQAVAFTRAMARTMTTLSDADALTMPDILPTWQSYLDAGEQIPPGVCIVHNGQCYRQSQSTAVTPQAHQPPDSAGMLAVYRPIERQHAGTQADPIPWVSGMDCYAGKYYSYNGHIYRVADGGTMKPCVWYPGMPDVWQWELVE